MPCQSIESILKNCDNPIGGIRRVFINEQDNVVTETPNLSAHTITLSATTAFSSIEFRKNLGMYVEDYTREDDGAIVYISTVTIPIHSRDAAKSRRISILAEGQRELALIVEAANGSFVYFRNVQLTSIADGSGAARTEASKYTIVFTGEQENLAFYIDPLDIPALLV